jgi:outer membrane protein OmpA-like peptidoglycan-associated protein
MRMRPACFLLTALLCTAEPALAQVTVDLQALESLPGARPAANGPAAHKWKPQPARRRVAAAKSHKPASGQATAQPATSSGVSTASLPPAAVPGPQPGVPPAPPPATLPTAPPATIALAPVPPPPLAAEPVAPPPPPPISNNSATAATPSGAGLRVTFGEGQADLSPASAEAIKNMVQSAPTGDGTSFNVVAYAAGKPEDPSTARRLSLTRALAVRSALMADGVGSSHIYVRALGATGGDEAPDRVDLAVMGDNASAVSPASARAPDAGAKSQSQ